VLIGTAMGGAAIGVVVTDDPLEAFAKAQAVIDFTAPAATVEFAALAAQARAVHVIGTTGLEAAYRLERLGSIHSHDFVPASAHVGTTASRRALRVGRHHQHAPHLAGHKPALVVCPVVRR
jgi:dihydrodipicolinate reductase